MGHDHHVVEVEERPDACHNWVQVVERASSMYARGEEVAYSSLVSVPGGRGTRSVHSASHESDASPVCPHTRTTPTKKKGEMHSIYFFLLLYNTLLIRCARAAASKWWRRALCGSSDWRPRRVCVSVWKRGMSRPVPRCWTPGGSSSGTSESHDVLGAHAATQSTEDPPPPVLPLSQTRPQRTSAVIARRLNSRRMAVRIGIHYQAELPPYTSPPHRRRPPSRPSCSSAPSHEEVINLISSDDEEVQKAEREYFIISERHDGSVAIDLTCSLSCGIVPPIDSSDLESEAET